jgi:hypothetical protein
MTLPVKHLSARVPWQDYQWIVPKDKKEKALNYFANGEIGVITGKFIGRKDEPGIEITFSTQPGYSYSFRPNELGEEGKYILGE